MPTPTPNTGGLQRVAYDMGRALLRRGHQVTLVGAKGSYLEGAQVIPACAPVLGALTTSEKAIGKAAFGTEYDVLLDVSHTHQAAYADPKHSVLWHQDVTQIAEHPRPVFISDSQRRLVYKDKDGYQVIPNKLLEPPVVNPLMPDGPARRHDVALFLGNLVPHKGAHLAIYIALKLGVPLWVAGPPLDTTYAERVLSLCDGEKVLYVGAVNEHEKYRLLSQARMTICAPNEGFSRYHETAQLVAMESAWMGTPVLASGNGGMSEYVPRETGRCGRNLREMLTVAPEVWSWEDRGAVMEYARANFGLDGVMDRWETLLREAATCS